MKVLSQALEAARTGSHTAAVELFVKLPDNLKLDAEQLYTWGSSHQALGEMKKAVKIFVTALRAQRDHYLARNALGVCLFALRKPRMGLVHLRYASEIRPDHPRALINMASVYEQMEEHRTALKYFERAHRCDFGANASEQEKRRGLSLLYYNWARSLAAAGNVELAMERYRAATAQDPELFLAYHNRALLLWEGGAYSEARTAWRKAYAIYKGKSSQPAFRKAHAQFAGVSLLMGLNDITEAERELLFAHEAHPENLQILSNLVTLYLEQSETQRFHAARAAKQSAHRFYSVAMEVWDAAPAHSRSRDNYYSIAQLLGALGQRERGIAVLAQAPDRVRRSARIDSLFGSMYLAQGAYTEAIVHLRAALAAQPRPQAATRVDLATALRKTGARDEAERELKQLLHDSPYNLDALVALGDLYAEMPDDATGYFADLAVRNYTLALSESGSDEASRPLNTRRLADVLYARAVERQKLLRLSRLGPLGAEAQTEVRQDLEQALKNDADHPRALHGLKKLRDMERASHTLLYSAAPWLIAAFSFWLFCMAQMAFLSGPRAERIPTSEYSLISFGAVLFFTAGCLLPTILRLKFATFELDVSPEPRTRSDEHIVLSRG